jgi:hypothetical protein
MNESLKEGDYDSIGMENEMNIHDVVQDASNYYELDIPRYDEIGHVVINETNCSVKDDDDQYLEMRSEMKYSSQI